VRLKKLRDQVIVLTGASSGIGLVTARRAARQGARLVLAARSELLRSGGGAAER
jgi:NADP-dependent 3-hydroxy acid dehydrogenase YdfG